jgi:hypothetical protein
MGLAGWGIDRQQFNRPYQYYYGVIYLIREGRNVGR